MPSQSPSPRQRAYERLLPAERIALWALRHARYGLAACAGLSNATNFPLGNDPRLCLVALRAAAEQGQRARNRPTCLALPGSLLVTDDESALLRATAAIQAGSVETGEAFLVALSPGPLARRGLCDALAILAAWLAMGGHWLPVPNPPCLLPVASIAVARLPRKGFAGAEPPRPRRIPRYASSRFTTSRNQAMP